MIKSHLARAQGATVLGAVALSASLAFGQATPAPAPTTEQPRPADEEEIVTLNLFEVNADSSTGYAATQTLAGSRLNTRLEDVGSAVSVITAEFLQDVAATDNKTLLAYTTNTEVGGTEGNFRAASGGQNQDESGRFTNPNQNTRVRGLTAADNTRNFFLTDIPWDGYNVERVDMQRGPNSILFGLGSPAGIINATTKSAQHRNFGSVEARFGSFGANRFLIDANQNILADELSVRLAALRNDERYRQDPARSLDRRVFGTLRYDPKFLSRAGHKTSLKLSYEAGKVRSNNPRTITPTDQITAWWDQLDQSVYDPNLVQNSGWFYDAEGNPYYPDNAGQYNRTHASAPNGDGTANPNYETWLGAPSFYGGVWARVNPGETAPYSVLQPEYRTLGGRNSAGGIDGSVGGLPFSRRVTVATTAYWAERDSNAPYQSWGLWKSSTLRDSSVFDFYNKLIDGHNKREWQDFDNLSVSLTQTFFENKFGLEGAFDSQYYDRGQYSFNGAGVLLVDINSHDIGGAPNANVGRPYVESNYTWGNSATKTQRESMRLSGFFDHDFDQGRDGGWLRQALGRHTISGLLSQDSYWSDARSFKRYGTTDAFASLVSSNPGTSDARFIDSNDRAVSATVYLGDSLLGLGDYRDARIARAGRAIQMPSTAQYSYFDSTWNASGVDPSAVWINTYNGQTSTQSENPANYVGWTSTPVEILSAENGDQDLLTWGATLNQREVTSKAIVWQGYLWKDSIVGMYGVRKDEVKSWAFDGVRVNNRVNFDALDSEGRKHYSVRGKSYSLAEATSPSWSAVVKLNRLLGDRLPVNVNLFYNESENFQVVGSRNDIYGNPLAPPSGETTDMGLVISTKDNRFIFKVNKYETTVKNATNTTGVPTWYLLGGGNFIQRQEDRADAYEYRLTELGNPNSVADTGTVTGTWTWRYAPRPGETQEQADALAASAVAGWRAYTQEPIVQRILEAWGFNDFSGIAPTTMSTPVANFVATEDQLSKGWEYEFTANPTKNWRVTFNASDTKARRTNIGGADLQEFISLTNEYHNGPMGQLRQWGGGGISSTALVSWNSNFYSKYLLMKLQEGTDSTELRRWRFNFVTNYSFDEGRLKGLNVGAGYRWQDKIAIGYPVVQLSGTEITFDLDNPYYGSTEDAIDLWVGYTRKLTDKIDWRIQLNVRNLGDSPKLIPLTTQYDGTVAAWGIAPSQTWTVTNTFSF